MTTVKIISKDREKDRLKPWQIALIVIGSVLAILVILGLVWLILYKTKGPDYPVITQYEWIHGPDNDTYLYSESGLYQVNSRLEVPTEVLRTVGGENIVTKNGIPGVLDVDDNFIGFQELLKYKIVDVDEGFASVLKNDEFIGFQEYLVNAHNIMNKIRSPTRHV